VLAAGSMVFKLHPTVLAAGSGVFADLFALGRPEANEAAQQRGRSDYLCARRRKLLVGVPTVALLRPVSIHIQPQGVAAVLTKSRNSVTQFKPGLGTIFKRNLCSSQSFAPIFY